MPKLPKSPTLQQSALGLTVGVEAHADSGWHVLLRPCEPLAYGSSFIVEHPRPMSFVDGPQIVD